MGGEGRGGEGEGRGEGGEEREGAKEGKQVSCIIHKTVQKST